MRVLVLTAHPDAGGPLPKLAPLVAQGLESLGDEVTLASWSTHTPQPEPLARRLLGRLGDLARVMGLVRRWKPDVLYVATAHNWPGLLRDAPLALLLGRHGPPFVLHFHGSSFELLDEPGRWVFTRLTRWLVRRASCVMVLSREELHGWRAACPDARFAVVLNPFAAPRDDRPRECGHGEEETVLVVARLIPEKGVADAIDAVALVRKARACRLLVAGDGPARTDLQRRAVAQGLDGAVELLGYVTGRELASAYQSADVFVLPSYHPEGFPLSVMEAMSHGLPIVTTPIRGCVDELVEGVNVVFVPPRDPQALAGVLAGLLDDRQLRRRMAAANIAKIREFAPQVVVPEYRRLLLTAVAERRRLKAEGRA